MRVYAKKRKQVLLNRANFSKKNRVSLRNEAYNNNCRKEKMKEKEINPIKIIAITLICIALLCSLESIINEILRLLFGVQY